MPMSGSVSSARVSQAGPGHRFPLRTLPSWAQLRTIAADSVVLGVACLISYWLTSRVLSWAYSISADDDALGGMWAVIATVFVFRDSSAKSLAAALSRLAATLVSFVLCLAYLTFLPFHLWGLAVLVGLSVLVTALIGRPGDEITAAITTTVVLVVAELSPHHAWQQPILRLADTAIGVTVGLAAAWLALHAIRPRMRRAGGRPASPEHNPDQTVRRYAS
jgi:uncharacterized membrane protein YgaE (UPF0421/DUF939 family)